MERAGIAGSAAGGRRTGGRQQAHICCSHPAKPQHSTASNLCRPAHRLLIGVDVLGLALLLLLRRAAAARGAAALAAAGAHLAGVLPELPQGAV